MRNALGNGRQRLAQLMRARLIPVSDGVKVIGTVIGISVFNGHFEVLLKRNGGVEVKTIDAPFGPSIIPAIDWVAVKFV
jgi:hypothetical protein